MAADNRGPLPDVSPEGIAKGVLWSRRVGWSRVAAISWNAEKRLRFLCACLYGDPHRPADAVFDRACHVEVRSDERLLLADRMLADTVRFDAMAVHDGALIALDALTTDEREQALSGFRYFGLHSAAETVELIADRAKTPPVGADAESALDREMDQLYALSVPDTAVAEAFADASRSPR